MRDILSQDEEELPHNVSEICEHTLPVSLDQPDSYEYTWDNDAPKSRISSITSAGKVKITFDKEMRPEILENFSDQLRNATLSQGQRRQLVKRRSSSYDSTSGVNFNQ